MADDDIEIITQDGRFIIPAADLETFRAEDADDEEVEGFAQFPGLKSTRDLAPTQTVTLQVGKRPVIRSSGFVAFAGETIVGSPF